MPRTEPAADPLTPVLQVAVTAPGRRWSRARAAWPPRRLVAVAVIAPALMVLLTAVSGDSVSPPGWTALAGLVALTAAATAATYLPRPGSGARLDVGCTPCASVAAITVPIAAVVLTASPHDVPSALLALGVAVFGLRQRLTDPSACPA
ncbi:hypothetical protein [Cellulomonas sp. WB94]|uniref:hypothetical protein n=1 Tax=Cellulomonas sp. WB94 TaxID=2173174 RepID=UPI0011B24E97|nr:hypothetical protein [Cellulomonas sp. WB94]